MSVPDMKADENLPGRRHNGWWSQRDEIVAFWCREPDYEADPGAFSGRMTVAPPLEVSTQAKLVSSRAPLAGCLKERSREHASSLSTLLRLGHPPKDGCGLRVADRGRRQQPAVRAHLW